MAELVGDGPGTKTLPVKHGCNRLPVGVGHHPLKRGSAPYPTVVTLDIVRVTMSANRIWEHRTCDSGSRALRSRKISTSQCGTRSTRMLDFVFGRLINMPWPFTRISVLSMLIKCRSRSTFGQVRASASASSQQERTYRWRRPPD